MSVVITQTVHALIPNLSIPFGVSGGTAPYIWSISVNASGGSIDSSSGEYTSGPNTGVDTVLVTDNLSATASYQMQVCTPLMLVADIIQTAAGLSNGQVYLWDQKINIPTDSRLYVAVGVVNSQPFGSTKAYIGTDDVFTAVQSVNVLDTVSIDILSRGPAARDNKELVLLALNSPYAESQMELNSFFVAPQSMNFVNLSEVDGAAIPYRYNITVNLQYFVTLSTNSSYYGSFVNPPTITTEA